jgi:Protein of unknwon function (DUF3310)
MSKRKFVEPPAAPISAGYPTRIKFSEGGFIKPAKSINMPANGEYFTKEEVARYAQEWRTETSQNNDPVNHPAHYTSDPSGVECIQITRHRNFTIGNAIKYLWRAGLKEPDDPAKQIEDLRKAVWYIECEIGRLSGEV